MSDEQAATQTTAQRLARPFAVSEHATVKKGGASQTYAPWTEYVERLNGDLGTSGWSFSIVREGFTATEAWVLGKIVASIDGERCVREQYGCEPITVGQSPNGDLLKKAASDALKKAASLLGIGLYLSVKEEREAMQALMRAEANKPAPNPTPRSTGAAAPAGRAAASTPTASGAGSSSSSTPATPAPPEPTALKTKAELAADLKTGIEFARSLGLEPVDVDPAPLNRAQIEEVIAELRRQCRHVRAARKAQAS